MPYLVGVIAAFSGVQTNYLASKEPISGAGYTRGDGLWTDLPPGNRRRSGAGRERTR